MTWKSGTIILPLALTLPWAFVACDDSAGAPAMRRTVSPAAAQQGSPEQAAPLRLEADHLSHDFGDVPIDAGEVSADFRIRNASAEPVQLAAVYSSCMCTTAVLEFDGWRSGPFGMPGHDLPNAVDREVAPGGQFTMRVTFDPAAHGPEGVGPTRRQVALHTVNGGFMHLELTANVVPGQGSGDDR